MIFFYVSVSVERAQNELCTVNSWREMVQRAEASWQTLRRNNGKKILEQEKPYWNMLVLNTIKNNCRLLFKTMPPVRGFRALSHRVISRQLFTVQRSFWAHSTRIGTQNKIIYRRSPIERASRVYESPRRLLRQLLYIPYIVLQ